MAPSKQRAAVIQEDGTVALQEMDVPKPGSGEILIKIVAAAQNPTDWKTVKFGKKVGSISGCDLSGVVEEIGPDVPAGVRAVGERVATMIHGGCYHNGAFSEYAVALADRVVHVPDSWSFEQAAQFGIAPLTACQTLWQSQKGLPTPLAPATSPGSVPILVWGGASSVGNYVVQMAKLSGLYVIATASQKNFELVKQLGADEVFDYKDPEVTKKIKEAAQKISKDGLKHAVDCVSEEKTLNQVVETLSEEGGVVSAILVPKDTNPRPGVTVVHSMAYQLMGKAYDFPGKFSPTPEDLEFGLKMWKLAGDILASGKLKPSPTLVMPKGLASVQDGFNYMMEGKVSGEKITYRISDTPPL